MFTSVPLPTVLVALILGMMWGWRRHGHARHTIGFWREMLGDKERHGCPISAGRTLAFMTGVTANLAVLLLAVSGVNPGAALAWIAAVAVLAVPAQKWLADRRTGPEILKALINRSGIGDVGGSSATGGVAGSVAEIIKDWRGGKTHGPDDEAL